MAGAHDTGYTICLGDGGNALKASVVVGESGRRAGFSGEVGCRYSGGTEVNTQAVGGAAASGESVDIPNEMFVNLGLFLPAGAEVTSGVDCRIAEARSGLDIGGPEFPPSPFPALEEDVHRAGGRAMVTATETVRLNACFDRIVRGDSTAVSTIFGVVVGFRFGGGGPES